LNILLTNTCTRNCPYCFARERVRLAEESTSPRPAPRYISREDFGRALSFAKTGGPREIGILGGEPSMHPEFLQLLDDAWEAGLHTKIFSNGMWRKEDLEALSRRTFPGRRRKPFHVVLNMNEPRRTPAHEQAAQHELLSRLGRDSTLSFNISTLDFDPLFLVDAIVEHRSKRHIRLGVAQPLAQLANEHIPVDRYAQMAPTLMRLAERCDQHNIRLGFDCGFLLCMFTEEQHGRLVLAGARFRADCGPTVDVGTDLSAWACFPLSTFSQGVMLRDFDKLPDLVRHFERHFRRLYRTGVLPECVSCRHRRRRQCAAGCAAHVYRTVMP
jgi:hypothetical protein